MCGSMPDSKRDTLRTLLRRVDEVRGLSDRAAGSAAVAMDDPDALVRTLGELVEDLERSHRRLIETNVQLVSLREVAGHLTTTKDVAETTRTVTRYLRHAFGFDHVGLLLIDRERARLIGTWAGANGSAQPLDLPLAGERGALARAVWLNRTLLHGDARRHAPAWLPEGHPLHDTLAGVGSFVCVPLQRSPSADGGTRCERCPLGAATYVAPPPGRTAEDWAAAREDAERRCLACDRLPSMGVIAAGRRAGVPPMTAADATLVESITLSVAPMVENARLFQELRMSQRFQQHVLDGMVTALLAVNLHGELLGCNRAAAELLGWREDEMRGSALGELFGAEAAALITDTLARGRDREPEESFLRARDGVPVPVRLSASPLRDDAGTVYGAVATFVDLRPIRRAEEQARQTDRLAALGRFTSSVAHEIRNPLTGIGMGVQHLSRALAGDEDQRRNLEFIQSEIRRLDRIVQQLFDVTHPRRLDRRARPLADTLDRSFRSLEAMLGERGVKVAFALEKGLPDVPHDADQVQQVFINLLKNAAEASAAGTTITVRATGPGRAPRGAPANVVVEVSDQGPGIDEAICRTLFEPFFTTKPGGTGLGLYITHDIVKRHGGQLTVQSEPGHGATFRVDLPLDPEGGKS
jgi:PAS domain S-box-containing protein